MLILYIGLLQTRWKYVKSSFHSILRAFDLSNQVCGIMGLQDSVRAGQSAAVRQQVVQAKRQATGFGMTNTKSVEDLKVAGEKLEQSGRADGGAAPGTPENTPNMRAFPEKADVEQSEDDPPEYLVNIVNMVQKNMTRKSLARGKL